MQQTSIQRYISGPMLVIIYPVTGPDSGIKLFFNNSLLVELKEPGTTQPPGNWSGNVTYRQDAICEIDIISPENEHFTLKLYEQEHLSQLGGFRAKLWED